MRFKHYLFLPILFCFVALADGLTQDLESTTFEGRIVDVRSEIPVGNATVRLVPSERVVSTNSDGHFQSTGVVPGTYSVEVTAEGYRTEVFRVAIGTEGAEPFEFPLVPTPRFTEEVFVTASRFSEPVNKLIQGAGIVENSELDATKRIGLHDTLNLLPGVKAESQADTEQVRISIRGRGVRTAFGVRGIKMLVDGIPESDASGETPDLTGIDMGVVDRIEVVKGPMSSQYGASANGVVNLLSEPGSGPPRFDPLVLFGSFGLARAQLKAAGQESGMGYVVNATRTTKDGHRDHSRLLDYRVSSKFDFQLGSSTVLSLIGRGSHNDSELPGSLSAQQVEEDPRQASPIFGAFGSRSRIDRFLLGAQVDTDLGAGRNFSAMFFGRSLDFELPVPFVVLDGKRDVYGGNARYSFEKPLGSVDNVFAVGMDLQTHSEDRKDFENQGGEKGTLVFRDETRNVDNASIYVFDEVDVTERLSLKLGVDYARVSYNVDDFLFQDGDNSGRKTFDQTTFLAGGAYTLAPGISVYGSVSSAFEPPTISEIGRAPDGGGGLNLSLEPQTSTSFEGGGLFRFGEVGYASLAVFRMAVQQEIVPAGEGFPQEVFLNAAETTHNGLELGAGLDLHRDVKLGLAYTYSDFYFRDYTNDAGDQSGNEIPGIPTNRFNFQLEYENPSGLFSSFRGELVGEFFVNDENTVTNPSYFVASWMGGYTRLFGRLKLTMMYGVENLFDEAYSQYIVINDRFGTYFYPSPPRNHFGRVLLNLYL